MVSEARWQTSIAAEESDAFSDDLRMAHPLNDPLPAFSDQPLNPPLNPPMDPRAVENLLRRLVGRFEESERRYGTALEELHDRLDHLSQTTDAARDISVSAEADSFARLHAQVSDLTRRLETESSTPLENFERLGKALTGGLRSDSENGAPGPYRAVPEPSPFAQSISTSSAPSRLAPEPDYPDDYNYSPFAPADADPTASYGAPRAEPDSDKPLMEIADRLEKSIASAIPTATIETLNSRIEDIGNQVAHALEAGPSRAVLEHVESQMSDMSQHLSRAEAQLGRIDKVEEHLLSLIARLDERDADPEPAEINPARLQEIATKAATDAARLVAEDTKKTTTRLDAMQHELTTMSEKSGQSGDRVVSTLEAVHESLKQLVRQGENPQAAKSRTPFAASGDTKPAAPFARSQQQPGQAAPSPKALEPKALEPQSSKSEISKSQSSKSEALKTVNARPQVPGLPETLHPKTPRAKTPRAETPSTETPSAETPSSKGPGLPIAAPGMTETSREQLRARVLGLSEVETAHAPGRTKPYGAGEDAIHDGLPNAAPDDLVAAARHAAQAAAARAEKRAKGRSAKRPPGRTAVNEPPAHRRRPLLIISAAVLLAISALLLYGRLGTKAEPEMAPSAGESITPDAATQPQAGENQAPAVPKTLKPAKGPDPASAPKSRTKDGTKNGGPGQAPSGVIENAKPSDRLMPGSAPKPGAQFASLKPSGSALPPGVVFTIEDPSSASGTADVEMLATTPMKAPMPRAALNHGSPLVTMAQELLNRLGYDVGSPDGVIGERTSSAVKLFQHRNGLKETGDVTIPLVRMLERSAG